MDCIQYEDKNFCGVGRNCHCHRRLRQTVSDTHTAAVSFGKDNVEQHFQRSLDQAYQAAVTVVNHNGAVVTEYIPHDTTNVVRSLKGEVDQCAVWVRVEALDPQITLGHRANPYEMGQQGP